MFKAINSSLVRASVLISAFFALNKLLGLGRQYLIVRQFGLGAEIDAFNVSNNIPDLIFSVFSGGALAMAFIPVFAEYLETQGEEVSWRLFSKVASFMFLGTAVLAVVIAILAPWLVSAEFGVAPGFSPSQQALVVKLLQLHLISTIIFSLSGLLTASLHAHKHFLYPAIAPLFYNLGIIFGVVYLAKPFGIYGLVYGVVLGAIMHFLIQVPGILSFDFKFSFHLDMHDPGVRKIFRLMWPRMLTVLLIQIMFLLRDNFASRLPEGSVTALTYAYFIMQVPETLIGTAIGTALLPTLSSHASTQRKAEFAAVLTKAFRVVALLSIVSAIAISVALKPLLELFFDFTAQQNSLLVLTTIAFMAGLLGHTFLEILVRAFYANQKAIVPMYATALRTVLFIILGLVFYQRLGVVGIAAIDSLVIGVEVLILFYLIREYVSLKSLLGLHLFHNRTS